MNYIRYMIMAIFLIALPMNSAEITRKQHSIYPQNPHLVKTGNEDLSPEERKKSIVSMQKVISVSRKAVWGFSVATIASLMALLKVEGTKARIGTMTISLLCATVTYIWYITGAVHQRMASNLEIVPVNTLDETAITTEKLVDITDGVYIFSMNGCPPCKLLHQELTHIRSALPNLEFFEYNIHNADGKSIIQRMNINIESVPLTIVVKNSIIIGIISGYDNKPEHFVQQIHEFNRSSECFGDSCNIS